MWGQNTRGKHVRLLAFHSAGCCRYGESVNSQKKSALDTLDHNLLVRSIKPFGSDTKSIKVTLQ